VNETEQIAEPLAAPELSLAETMRIMDVASALRRERELARSVLDAEQIQEQLRRRLKATAEVTGESVSAAEIDAAIRHYYANLHAFREPAKNLSWFLAHLYIRRTWVGLGLLASTVALSAWLLLT